ncbi:hypothetical protein H9L12_04800 [Sphingomonas rhizophila]|jgi:hypothetical protein|uniref:Lipoprotein n=1 Tax=Sphingomonas rhizophila TaxID=2071607 RepID=A0A7G9SDD2_9SPHN|nr:hypothetical protein [Sphingomonas rhizophila]QNN65857.1 hypothetical protein H9L12_04800 [Sphingomonas rhizophila]
MRAMMCLGSAVMSVALGACQVTEDKGNGTTTVEFNQEVAENSAAVAVDKAQDVAGTIAADAKREADKLGNEIGDVKVDVDINRDNDKPAPTTNSQ